MKIDQVKSYKIFLHRVATDFQYKSINLHQLISIDNDFDRLYISSIGHAGGIQRTKGKQAFQLLSILLTLNYTF